MAHNELVEYITSSRKSGISEPQITQALTSVGWKNEDIIEAFGIVHGEKPNTDSSFSAVIRQIENPTLSASTTASITGALVEQNATPQSTPQSVEKLTAQKNTPSPSAQSTASSKKLIIGFIVFCILVLIGGGVFFAYKSGLVGDKEVVHINKPIIAPVNPDSDTPATSTAQVLDSQTAQWKTYTDSDNQFSLQYPAELTPSIEKVVKNAIDNVRFQTASSSTVFQINIQNVTKRWPDLKTFVSDQYITSKGVDNPVPIFITTSSGATLQDVGEKQLLGHTFIGQLNETQFIIFSFKDGNLIHQVLSSLKVPTNQTPSDN